MKIQKISQDTAQVIFGRNISPGNRVRVWGIAPQNHFEPKEVTCQVTPNPKMKLNPDVGFELKMAMWPSEPQLPPFGVTLEVFFETRETLLIDVKAIGSIPGGGTNLYIDEKFFSAMEFCSLFPLEKRGEAFKRLQKKLYDFCH